MKHLNLLWLCTGLASAAEPAIQTFTLDEHAVRLVPISRSRVTTFSFPSALQAVSGANLTPDGRTPGAFQLDYKPGSFFLSVRALNPGATGNLNVIWNHRPYVFELDETTNAPVLSVLLEPPVRRHASASIASVTPTRLLGLLQMAKSYAALSTHHASALQGVTTVRPNRVCDYGDFVIHIEEVFRFDLEDTLVFRLRLQNRTSTAVPYRSGSFAARVGERLFHQSISDASGVLPPNSKQPAWFAITGLPNGARHELSLKNDFIVLVTRD